MGALFVRRIYMRNVLHINENWIFVKDMTEAPASLPQTGELISLPHTWNAIDGQDGGNDYWRGTATYSKNFISPLLTGGEHCFIEFRFYFFVFRTCNRFVPIQFRYFF